MSSSPEILEERDGVREDHMPPQQPLTPSQDFERADGYRRAALDVTDLDPPTWFPPQPVN